jgi:hypothetical protein
MGKGNTYKRIEYENDLVKIIILGYKDNPGIFTARATIKNSAPSHSDKVNNILSKMFLLLLAKSYDDS